MTEDQKKEMDYYWREALSQGIFIGFALGAFFVFMLMRA